MLFFEWFVEGVHSNSTSTIDSLCTLVMFTGTNTLVFLYSLASSTPKLSAVALAEAGKVASTFLFFLSPYTDHGDSRKYDDESKYCGNAETRHWSSKR